VSITPRPGRIDPTVRALLRGFVSPTLADRWAARLQPIAVADHRAAVTGAVSLLQDEVGVDGADLAVALVEDVGWSSPDAGALLGLTALEVRIALAAGGRSTPRAPRHHREPWLLRGRQPDSGARPTSERRVSATAHAGTEASAAVASTGDAPDGTDDGGHLVEHHPELRSRLPRRPSAPDRRPALLLVITVLLGLAGLAAGIGAGLGTPAAGPDDVAPVTTPSPRTSPDSATSPDRSPSPTLSPPLSPTPSQPPDTGDGPGRGLPDGAESPVVETLRLVDVADVLTGRPEPADVGASFGAVGDVRVWGALDRSADEAVVVRVAVTAPDGRRSVRPVLVPAGVRSFALSLPAELGSPPGRWLVTAVLGDGEVLRHEAELSPLGDGP